MSKRKERDAEIAAMAPSGAEIETLLRGANKGRKIGHSTRRCDRCGWCLNCCECERDGDYDDIEGELTAWMGGE